MGVFTNPSKAKEGRSFKLRQVDPPDEYAKYFEKIVLVEKLREVRALVGFTRIMSPRDFDNPADVPENRRAAISRKKPTWLPASRKLGAKASSSSSTKNESSSGSRSRLIWIVRFCRPHMRWQELPEHPRS